MANAAIWKRRLAEWRASGLTAAEFAAGREYAASTLTWWSWRLGRAGGSDTAEAPVRSAPVASGPPAPAPRLPRTPAPSGGAAGELRWARVIRTPALTEVPIVLEHASVRVIVHRGFERATLLDVLDALDARGARS